MLLNAVVVAVAVVVQLHSVWIMTAGAGRAAVTVGDTEDIATTSEAQILK